jgi:hypothetical protein
MTINACLHRDQNRRNITQGCRSSGGITSKRAPPLSNCLILGRSFPRLPVATVHLEPRAEPHERAIGYFTEDARLCIAQFPEESQIGIEVHSFWPFR